MKNGLGSLGGGKGMGEEAEESRERVTVERKRIKISLTQRRGSSTRKPFKGDHEGLKLV